MKSLAIKASIVISFICLFAFINAQGPGDGQYPNSRPGNRTNDGMPGATGAFKHNTPPVDSTPRNGMTGTSGNKGTKGATGPTGYFAPTGLR